MVDTYYLVNLLDSFQTYAATHLQAANQRATVEQQQLLAALENATNGRDKRLLEVTAAVNEETRLGTQNAYSEMINFATTIKQAMGAQGGATSCEDLTCGDHASCFSSITEGAKCQCDSGWTGNGFICKPPAGSAQGAMLLQGGRSQVNLQVADVHVSSLDGSNVMVTYRDISNGHGGSLMLGQVGATSVKWGKPIHFSGESKAYGPTSTVFPDGRIIIAFRDEDRDGRGLVLAGKIGPDHSVTLGSPKAFARRQARQMALVQLPDSHAAIVFADHVTGAGAVKGKSVTSSRGAALLARVWPEGLDTDLLGKYRFSDAPAARFAVTSLTPTSFVIAYREGARPGVSQRSEAAAVWGQLHNGQLVFDPHHLSLEPRRSQIWSRSLSLISQDTFAYTYYSGEEQVTKQAVVHLNPASRRMQIVDGPKVIDSGFTPFLGSVSKSTLKLSLLETSEAAKSTQTFSYFSKPSSGFAGAKVCGLTQQSHIGDCEDVGWSDRELASASGTAVADGRALLVFTDAHGTPFFQFMGLA